MSGSESDHFGLKNWLVQTLSPAKEIKDGDVLALGLAMDELMKPGSALAKKYRLDDLLVRFK